MTNYVLYLLILKNDTIKPKMTQYSKDDVKKKKRYIIGITVQGFVFILNLIWSLHEGVAAGTYTNILIQCS